MPQTSYGSVCIAVCIWNIQIFTVAPMNLLMCVVHNRKLFVLCAGRVFFVAIRSAHNVSALVSWLVGCVRLDGVISSVWPIGNLGWG